MNLRTVSSHIVPPARADLGAAADLGSFRLALLDDPRVLARMLVFCMLGGAFVLIAIGLVIMLLRPWVPVGLSLSVLAVGIGVARWGRQQTHAPLLNQPTAFE